MVAPKATDDDLEALLKEFPGEAHHSLSKIAAERFGMAHRQAMRRFAKLRESKNVGGVTLYGTSTLYDSQGNVKLRWEKAKHDNFEAYAREYVEALVAPIKPLKRTKTPKATNQNLMACLLLGDPHFGMLSWKPETGSDWDLKIAEATHLGAVERLVHSAPDASECIILNLGDYYHMDDRLGVTPGSKNPLDVDGRYLKVMRIGIRAMRAMIDLALSKFKTVRVRNVSGNHDPHTSITLTLTLAALYEKEPRVIVEDSPEPFWTFTFGKSLVGVTHGHQLKKPESMAQYLAVHDPKGWGSTQYRHVWHGHIHHRRVLETGGVVVESFRTLAGPDAWHVAEGYRAGREMVCIVLDKEYGEIERHTASLARSA